MTARLLNSVRWDVQLQFRNGFYYASAFVAVIATLIFMQLNNETLRDIYPVLLVGNMLINTFYFMAGILLLEKGEGTLEGLVVTPLRKSEYLLSKLVTLCVLALVESSLIVILPYGFGFNFLWLTVSIVFMAAMYCLMGFVMVVRYDSINTFLLPSIVATTLLSLPMLSYFGLWDVWLMYLHPVQAPLLLAKAAFLPIETWQIVYGLLYSALWIGVLFWWSQKAFYQFVILKQGVK